MATIFGALGLNDNDRVFNNVVGQRAIYDVINAEVQRYNNSLDGALAVFVERQTEEFKWRYKLPGGGFMSKRGQQSKGPAVKSSGSWDVAYPLEDYDEAIWADDVSRAYMTAQEFQNHLTSIFNRDTNQLRWEMLHRLLDNVQLTFVDPLQGNLTVEPLANGDTVVYPPVLGATSEATEDHYLESGYLAANISDVNNPLPTIRDEIDHHFGSTTGGQNIIVFQNNAQNAKVEDLTDFDPVPDRFIRVGDNADVPVGLPNVPGKILGRSNGCWVVEWRWVPANYMIGVNIEEIAPLIQRVDPADTGLPRGLALVSPEGQDEDYPFRGSEWRRRYGFGAGNRLNGVVMELGTGGTYTIPTDYD